MGKKAYIICGLVFGVLAAAIAHAPPQPQVEAATAQPVVQQRAEPAVQVTKTTTAQAPVNNFTYSQNVVYAMNDTVLCRFASDLVTADSLRDADQEDLMHQQMCLVVPKDFKVLRLDSIGRDYIKVLAEAGGQKLMLWGHHWMFNDAMLRDVERTCGPYTLSQQYDDCRKPIVDKYELVP